MKNAGDFSVAFVSSATEIDSALWDSCFPPAIEGRWWYDTLERSGLGDQFTFLYAVIRRGGAAVSKARVCASAIGSLWIFSRSVRISDALE